MKLNFRWSFGRGKSLPRRQILVQKGLSQMWWRILLYVFIFLLQLLMQLVLIIFLIKNFTTPWNSIKLSGLVRVCLILSDVIGIADSGIGLTTVLFVYRFIIERDWLRVNQILSSAHRQHRLSAKTSLVIILFAVFAYVIANWLFSNHFSPLIKTNLVDFRSWSVGLVMIFILSKNIIALTVVGAKENLIQADQNRNVILILNLIVETMITTLVLTLLWIKWPLFFAFLPFMCYSPLKIVLINLFCWSNYPWLKLKTKSSSTRSLQLIHDASIVMFKKIGSWILINVDFIIILTLFGFRRMGLISFFLIFNNAFLILFLRIFRSFGDFLGLSLTLRGRIRWERYLQFNNLCYLGAGMCFFLQLVLAPYLANIFFNDIVFNVISDRKILLFADFIFFKPWFALLKAIISVLVLLLEVNNILIDVNRYHREVYRSFYVVATLNFIISFLVTTAVFFTQDSYIATLLSVMSIQIFFLCGFYIYLSLIIGLKLTTGVAWPQKIWQPALLLLLPMLTVSLLFLLVVYPNQQVSFANFFHSHRSAVLNWSFIKFILLCVGAMGIHGVLTGLSGLIVFGPKIFSYYRYHRLRSSTKPAQRLRLKAAEHLISIKN